MAEQPEVFSTQAICPHLSVSTPIGSDTEYLRRAVGELYLSQGIALANPDHRRLHRMKLIVRPCSEQLTTQGDEYEQISLNQRIGALLFVEITEISQISTGEVTLNLPEAEYQALVQRADENTSLSLTIYLPAGDFIPLTPKGDEKHIALKAQISGITLHSKDSIPPAYFQDRAYRDIRTALASCYLSDNGESLVAKITGELARSAASTTVRTGLPADLDKVRSLLQDFRPAFLEEVATVQDDSCNLWWCDPSRLLTDLAQRDSEEAGKLKRRYDAIWRHFDAAKTIAEGEAQYGPGTQGLQPKTVELEHVAQQLLALGPIRSPLLEWALVDALIYCECVAFAQTFLSGNTLLGVAVPGELKGVSLSALGWKSLGKSVLGLLSESLKLLATFIFSVVVAQENMQSAWVITTGITAARWLRKAILAHAPNPSQKKHELLARMLNCQHLASGPDFNARLLREHLYKVTTDGAVFSPWVFNILDKRIAVENNLNR